MVILVHCNFVSYLSLTQIKCNWKRIHMWQLSFISLARRKRWKWLARSRPSSSSCPKTPSSARRNSRSTISKPFSIFRRPRSRSRILRGRNRLPSPSPSRNRPRRFGTAPAKISINHLTKTLFHRTKINDVASVLRSAFFELNVYLSQLRADDTSFVRTLLVGVIRPTRFG